MPQQLRALRVLLLITVGILAGCASRPSVAPARFAPPLPVIDLSDDFGRRGFTRQHEGIDLRAPSGTPVLAPDFGQVTFTGSMRGYGRTIILTHPDGVETLYAHLSEIAVRPGLFVETGQVLGAVGTSGNATGAHLHFEVRVRGEPIDPWPTLRPGIAGGPAPGL